MLITVLVSKYSFYFHSYIINFVNIKCTRFYIYRCSYYGGRMICLLYSTIITTYELFILKSIWEWAHLTLRDVALILAGHLQIYWRHIFTISVDMVMRVKLQNLINDKSAVVYLKIWCRRACVVRVFCPKHRRLRETACHNMYGNLFRSFTRLVKIAGLVNEYSESITR